MNSPFMSIKENIIFFYRWDNIFFIEIDYAYTSFANIINILAFLKHKNKHTLIKKIQRYLKCKIIIIDQLLYYIKKSHQFILFTV